ncbi:hypothetical protein HRR83_003319 [Exophiala dermatitidis]|uniref:DUF6314 domain-containing protein n=2 Tax=Exophiala dermatitidis TaxID=5970 RepID=H6BMT9_EXODN|nr:uncharacterized protein HMPREF1120_00334 [Exophiala dermatitidis NIH/UT8656]KAJ4514773.1 hypothetical protein HRR75_004137 [Exophiala dermatitidis]EHY52117.1 hypothetical protein HMPREF1120_00334 [Exophiala dermatitidis NIH/UT8656]KAJ4518228.1 hypothetical protein HRR74_004523 [Exophiala dermatitidis]KAJ4521126.1 hypothetical protein HRR73_003467 [Exophiala dermatitidis]KAJ4547714.1 hypothetical protein HRR76_000341 [Exophiala dermatitidis]
MLNPASRLSRVDLINNLFHTLQGTWLLDRNLQSADPTAPSGRCLGKATFTPTQPSPVLDEDGKLQLAESELLYHEQGELEMAQAIPGQGKPLKLPFSRKYIWRLNRADDAVNLSVWFTKPGTDTIDYLFHHIDIPYDDANGSASQDEMVLHGNGGHLCVADFYSSSYSFSLSHKDDGTAILISWKASHEVRGPKKDQIIETTYTKA